ncbi:uncharacterized protein LOC129251465 isoform X1 [Anastrepha obliqua]|uniref:uncharacterized protein LOC129251465 isoform X1 n=1 Tax=Anastrepha obliqua TaxID=95512 RepID=UPI00240A8ED6|nr:uncharacterized protein LOC129251465 isoform X1 [Anastrepha obliqua]XP_054746790.1 uncharacterized protein LOC129251465 isoform X1 [Anastrepha obliqua]XP_054746792.1 uncharacterized protein LOC129251465 isoform X1 [Anastrepha obliqua]XP_054746794.1 uncharacterized protein LOC129251465 isoform X1 [Anastrepha obliqua]
MSSIALTYEPKARQTQYKQQTQRRLSALLPLNNEYRRKNLVELAAKGCPAKRLAACTEDQYSQRRQRQKCTTKTARNRSVSFVDEAKATASNCRLSFWRYGANYNLRTDSMLMMIIIFAVVMAVVISEKTVLAAQRDSVKQKNPNNLSSNANVIPTGSGGVASSGTSAVNGNGNGNAIGGGNTNPNRHNNDITNGNPNNNASAASNGNSATVDAAVNYVTIATSTTVAIETVLSSSSSPVSSSNMQKNGGSGAFPSGTSVVNRNTIEVTEDARNGPYFDKAASKNVTALLGKTAYLNCRVKNLGNKTMLLQVSWVRHRDIHLLTVGRYTYTSDQRFRAIHQPQTEDWILQIKYPQHRDSGIYECQVSTTPHMSHYIHLNVVEPSTEIIGAPDLYIESGSTINLTCVILNSPEPPAYIFWNHNNAIINYDSPRGGVSVVTNKGETTTSFLLIKTARPSDSGHYQCNPSNAKPKSVTVHVLNGVSHSVSRGVPSSNAARGTSASSNVPKSLSPSVPVYVLVHLSVCQVVYAAIGSSWHQGSRNVRHLVAKLLSVLALLATELLNKRQANRRKCGISNNNCGCSCIDVQLKGNAQLQQQQSVFTKFKVACSEVIHRKIISKTRKYYISIRGILRYQLLQSSFYNTINKSCGSNNYANTSVLFDRHKSEPDIR